MKHEIKPVATFNDIVQVAGYGNNLFEVDAFTYEYHHEPDASFTEVIYDLTCVYGDSGYIIAEQDDVTLACKAEFSSVFLQTYNPTPTPEDKPSFMAQIYRAIGNGGDEMKKPAKVKVPTKQQRIDALLDERIIVIETDGWVSVDEDGYKQRRLDEIDAKIREVQAE